MAVSPDQLASSSSFFGNPLFGLAGAGASLAGGVLQVGAQNRQARLAGDELSLQAALQQSALNEQLYGDSKLEDILARLQPGNREAFIRERYGIVDESGANLSQMQLPALLAHLQSKGVTGRSADPSGSIMAGYNRLSAGVGQRQQGLMGSFDQDTARLMGMARGIEGTARTAGNEGMALARGAEGIAGRFGQGAERLIDEDAARSLRGANQTARASLNASGFGNSTAYANQAGQNASNVGREATRAKIGVRQATTDRMLGARGQTIGVSQANAGRLQGAQTQTLGLGSQRAGQRTILGNQFLDRDIGLRRGPLDLRTSLLQSSIFNPWVGQNMSSFVPGGSPAGTALTSGGNAAALLWGMHAFR